MDTKMVISETFFEANHLVMTALKKSNIIQQKKTCTNKTKHTIGLTQNKQN